MDNQDRGLTIDNAISWLNDNDIAEGERGLCIVIEFCLTHGDFEMHFLTFFESTIENKSTYYARKY